MFKLFLLVIFAIHVLALSSIAQVQDDNGKRILFYFAPGRLVNLGKFSSAEYLNDYFRDHPNDRQATLDLAGLPNRTFALLADTVEIDSLHVINMSFKKGNLMLPFKNIAIIAKTIILRGLSDFNLMGDTSVNGTLEDKSGGNAYIVADEMIIEENGGLSFELSGGSVFGVSRKFTTADNGNGGHLFFSFNKLTLNASEIYKMNQYFAEFYSSMYEDLYTDVTEIKDKDRDLLYSSVDKIYTDITENKKMRDLISTSTRFSKKTRSILVDATVSDINSGLLKDTKTTVLNQGLSFFSYRVSKGTVPTTGVNQGTVGSAIFFENNDIALVSQSLLNNMMADWIIIQLKDFQFKMQKAIQSQQKPDLYKLLMKYNHLKIYDINDPVKSQLVTTLLQNLNDIRHTNTFPINIQRINSDFEENVYVANLGISNSYYVLPNRIALSTWSINNTDYSGILKFDPTTTGNFEIFLTGKITSSYYSEVIAKEKIILPPIGGDYLGILDKLNFTKAEFDVYGIDLNNSYCHIVGNNIFVKIKFDDTKDENVLLTMLLDNGIPMKINWELSEDKNYTGVIKFILKTNSLLQPGVLFEKNTVINTSRFPITLNYLVLSNLEIKELTPSVTILPNQKQTITDIISTKEIAAIPFDAIRMKYTYLNNGLFPSSNNDIIKEIRVRNLLPLLKNNDQYKSLKISVSWKDIDNKQNVLWISLLPGEEKAINIFYPIGREYKFEISGIATYSNSQFKIKDFSSSATSISIDNNSLDIR
jgi:hypothetical protein